MQDSKQNNPTAEMILGTKGKKTTNKNFKLLVGFFVRGIGSSQDLRMGERRIHKFMFQAEVEQLS
jgi:hypothetical protein